MNDNVIYLAARKRSARRPQVSLAEFVHAQVLALPERSKSNSMNDAAADMERTLDQIAFHLLQAGRAIAAHTKKHCR